MTGSLSESGGRLYSLDGVIERIELAFLAETPPDRLRALVDEADQRVLLREIADYVLVTTGLRLSRIEYLQVIDALHALIFRLGILDPYLHDETVCDLTIEGSGVAAFRRFGDIWQTAPERFLDQDQVTRIVSRLAIRANRPFGRNAANQDAAALTEIGAQFFQRPARLSVTAPPISPTIEVAIRLHPTLPPTLDTLIADQVLSAAAGETIRRALADRRGILVAGESGAGKTIFIQALLSALPVTDRQYWIERAGELRPIAQSDTSVQPPIARFGAPSLAEPITQAVAAIAESPDNVIPAWLIVDEVRADEAVDWWSLLTIAPPIKAAPISLIWAFRSSPDPKRLRTSLNMLLRQVQANLPQPAIDSALRDRLPLIVLLGHRGARTSKPIVLALGGWTPAADGSIALSLTPDGH